MESSRSNLSDVLLRVRERFARLPAATPGHLTVAYSGGLDSTVLLHLLARLAPEAGFVLSAIHVHHGLSAHADAWAAHCAQICAALGVPLQVCRVAVKREGHGLEAAARTARHAVLAQTTADWIVLAQHADDQAETLLHRLLRGCGVAGAAAMRERDAERRLWRPLLAETRQTLQAWAQAEGLRWVEDDSNTDERLTRNFLRHQILAPLKTRFPSAPANLLRATRHFAEAEDLLQELAAEDAARVRFGEAGARSRLRALSAPRARNLLRYWIAQSGAQAPDAARLDELLQAVRGEGAVRWVHAGHAFCAWREMLWCEAAEAPQPEAQVWRGEAALPWGAGELLFTPSTARGALRLDPAADVLQIKARSGSVSMRLEEGRPTRLFKQLCQESGIPAAWRAQLPLLWRGEEVLWIGGVGGAASARAAEGETGWRIAWRGPDGVTR
ncbi:tRNA lysidine(34) synthetase TilS [Uliginosibacterium flavum]|uniref:tRNA(Ile)-lysidine synthase n=1 Tax=Uliginosibacterium flavum TaxID=1396831 RepID=A0ABV2TGB5_9RHOO